MKICSKCKLPKEEFYADKRKPDGLKSWCKQCHLDDSRKREGLYNETRRRYRADHKEEAKEKKRVYYLNNKETVLKSNKAYMQSLNGRLISYKNGAKLRNIEWDLSKEEFETLWQKPCTYCGSEISTIGIDRLDSKQGYKIDNITPCCYQCNIIKMDYSKDEFINKIKQIYNYLKL